MDDPRQGRHRSRPQCRIVLSLICRHQRRLIRLGDTAAARLFPVLHVIDKEIELIQSSRASLRQLKHLLIC
jgi:hypothetical protein